MSPESLEKILGGKTEKQILERQFPIPMKRSTIGRKETQDDDFKNISKRHDDLKILQNSQPFEQNTSNQEKENSDASDLSELRSRKKLQMLISLMDIPTETKTLATNKLQAIGENESVTSFFQWIHRIVELKRIEEVWQTGSFQEHDSQKEKSSTPRKKKLRYHMRLCYCCRQKGHLAKDCLDSPGGIKRKCCVNKKTLSQPNRTLDAIRLLQAHKIMT